MLLPVNSFCDRASGDLPALIAELQDETGRYGTAESLAWQESLPTLARVLGRDELRQFHLHLGKRGSVSAEYRLPATASYADAVLLGRTELNPVVLMIELKNWGIDGDSAFSREGLIVHQGRLVGHPSDQVKGYVEYARRFHSAVQDDRASVAGCVFLTSANTTSPYLDDPYEELTRDYPVFSMREATDGKFSKYLAKNVTYPDEEFASRFESGTYRQDRGFVKQVAQAIKSTALAPFVLLDNQRVGFETCMAKVDDALLAGQGEHQKQVIIIEGPPGSGKSIVAAQLWATLASDDRIDGNVVLTTTSGSQKSNWKRLFEEVSGERAGRGLVVGANRYNPGLSPKWVKEARAAGKQVDVSNWPENLVRFEQATDVSRCPDDTFAVSIVDEAHALIDPTVPGKEGVPPSGWAMHAGPQAYHVIRSSVVSIFLLDSEQSYRDNETTSIDSIRAHARDLGAAEVDFVSLAGSQFRCGGSDEYVSWVSGMLGLDGSGKLGNNWRSAAGGPFDFEVVETPFEGDELLNAKIASGRSARWLASYARPWVTKDIFDPSAVRPDKRDFNIIVRSDSGEKTWSRIWNFAPEQDYTLFVQAPPGCEMALNPLSEVGCPYVVRGFDFDYVGLLWLSDLVWRGNRWVVNIDHVHESAFKKTRSMAKRESTPGKHTDELLRRVKRGYRILLTRALRGAYVWFEDEETRAYVEAKLGVRG